MMKYMGSKNRHAKELLPIILKDRAHGQWYVEPFVGGANMIDKVDGNRIGADIHPHLICLLDAVANGWIPPENVTEEEYKQAQQTRHIDALTGFIGFGASYSGKWFGGYARSFNSKNEPRNHASESQRNLIKQASNINGVIFICSQYDELAIPQNSIIYCDPPYQGTTKYATGGFDHFAFWQWCRDKVAEGHKIFVSEYNAPSDWVCVWEKKASTNFDSNRSGASERVEKLFVHTSQLEEK